MAVALVTQAGLSGAPSSGCRGIEVECCNLRAEELGVTLYPERFGFGSTVLN